MFIDDFRIWIRGLWMTTPRVWKAVIIIIVLSHACRAVAGETTVVKNNHPTGPVKEYEHLYENGFHNLSSRIYGYDKKDSVDLIFVWDDLESQKAWVFVLDVKLKKGVDDYMLCFRGDVDKVFPMERFYLGDPDRELMCEIRKEDLMEFLYELTHTGPRLCPIELTSEKTKSTTWVLEVDRIPDYIDH